MVEVLKNEIKVIEENKEKLKNGLKILQSKLLE